MSKVLACETQFTDMDTIRQALEQQGFTPVYQEGYPSFTMKGYSSQTFQANLGVTKANFTEVTKEFTYGDMGFEQKASGEIGFTGDDLIMNTPYFKNAFDGIKSAYAEKKYTSDMYQNGFTLSSRSVNAAGEVEMEFAPMVSI
jgi:hypothetical protein